MRSTCFKYIIECMHTRYPSRQFFATRPFGSGSFTWKLGEVTRSAQGKKRSNVNVVPVPRRRNDSYRLVYLNHAKWQVEEICLWEGASRDPGWEVEIRGPVSETMRPIGNVGPLSSPAITCHHLPGFRIHHTRWGRWRHFCTHVAASRPEFAVGAIKHQGHKPRGPMELSFGKHHSLHVILFHTDNGRLILAMQETEMGRGRQWHSTPTMSLQGLILDVISIDFHKKISEPQPRWLMGYMGTQPWVVGKCWHNWVKQLFLTDSSILSPMFCCWNWCVPHLGLAEMATACREASVWSSRPKSEWKTLGLGPWVHGFPPCNQTWLAGKSPNSIQVFMETPSMNGGCSIATFDYRRAMNGLRLLNGLWMGWKHEMGRQLIILEIIW